MKTRYIVSYIVLAFALSWSWWIPMAVSGQITRPGQGWPTHLIGLMGPAVAALAVTWRAKGRTGLAELVSRITRLRVSWVWYAIVVATSAMIALSLGSNQNPAAYLTYSGSASIGWLVVPYVLLANGFGEEIGWRGFLADALLHRFSRGITATFVWVVWGLWHLPLFWIVGNFMDLGVGGTIGWTLGLLTGSIFLTWMYDSAKSSIFIVALWHTAFNFSTATTATAGVTAAISSTVVMIVAGVILAWPGTWRRPIGLSNV